MIAMAPSASNPSLDAVCRDLLTQQSKPGKKPCLPEAPSWRMPASLSLIPHSILYFCRRTEPVRKIARKKIRHFPQDKSTATRYNICLIHG